jgi:meiotically up-regulated gene 157 (Mug157) protein
MVAVVSFCVLSSLSLAAAVTRKSSLPDVRPSLEARTFTSPAINNLITNLTPYFADPDIAQLFSNCLPNTLDTTVYYHGVAEDGTNDLDSFVITGDIEALWLRDSANQVIPYVPYASEDSDLSAMITGLINRQAKSILINPFANSFNYNASGAGAQTDYTIPRMTPTVFENKYEIDSISAFLKLSYWHWQYSGDTVLTSTLSSSTWLSAAEAVVNTISTMQYDDGTLTVPNYEFQRVTAVATDTLYLGGRGPPGTVNGLSRSLFRPSDDAVTLPYNVPGNAMACVELRHLQSILGALVSANPANTAATSLMLKTESTQSTLCAALGDVLNEAANKDDFILPYEVDGGRGKYFIDDANVPSLLSLPVLGFLSASNDIYYRTRQFVLSKDNKYFFSGW